MAMAESLAIEHGVPTRKIGESEALALHAGAFNGIPLPADVRPSCSEQEGFPEAGQPHDQRLHSTIESCIRCTSLLG